MHYKGFILRTTTRFRSPFFLPRSPFPFSQDVYLFIYLDKTFQEEHKFEPLPG